ncbi:MAG: hypothetical protein ACI9OJ_001618 [Myxococcota bacterium]|jgi:hypothetical protein
MSPPNSDPGRSLLEEAVSSLMGVPTAILYLVTEIARFEANHRSSPPPDSDTSGRSNGSYEETWTGVREAIDRAEAACWAARDDLDHTSQAPLRRTSTRIRNHLYRLVTALAELVISASGPPTVEEAEGQNLFSLLEVSIQWYERVVVLLPPGHFLLESGRDYIWELHCEAERELDCAQGEEEEEEEEAGTPLSPEMDESIIGNKQLRPCVMKAHAVFKRARELWPEMVPNGNVATADLFDRVRKSGDADNFPAYIEHGDWYGPPAWRTFQRYVNEALHDTDGPKRQPRRGRGPTRSLHRRENH